MPNLIVEYRRARGESVADAHDAVRAIIEEKKGEVEGAGFASDPAWSEQEKEDGTEWLVARLPYKFASPIDAKPIPVVVAGTVPAEDEEPGKAGILDRIFSKDICSECGKGPYKNLAAHMRVHNT